MATREQEINQIIQNMEIILNNRLPENVANSALQAYQDARFILDIELLTVFQASLKTISKNGLTSEHVIRDSLLLVTTKVFEHQRNNWVTTEDRLQEAAKEKNRLLNFLAVSSETEEKEIN